MDRIDKSLDDIIKQQRDEKKKLKHTPPAKKQTSIPKKASGGVQSRAAIRATREARASKPNSPYARPTKAKEALFTASFRTKAAPITEIFTAGYIPKPKSTLKLFTTNNKAGRAKETVGPISTKSIRMVTTQAPKAPARDSVSLTSASASLRLSTQQSKQPPQQRPDARSTLSTTNRNDRNDNSFGNRNAQDNRSAPSRANNYNSTNHGNSHGSNHRIQGSRESQGVIYNGSHSQQNRSRQEAPKPKPQVAVPETVDLDMDVDTPISIRGVAPGESVAFRGESGPVTIEIENLDPGTTADDVKYVCSRFGEIKSCMCSNGYAQVTYARKAAGQAAIDNLHGKKADNGQILRVVMRPNPIIHNAAVPAAPTPTPLSGPMKILERAVHGTITNAGTIYSDQLLAAQQMLKVQQHKMAQLQQEEQRIASMRLHANTQMNDLNSLSSSSRGFF
ncbi:hypothetical protein BGZ93_010532 [Podila epicladia]|nr:hypothetical protein BGZ93_010532 [Podila epicladia]